VMQQAMEVERTVIVDYRVLADTVVAGERAFRVQRHSAMTAAGSGSPNGTAVTLQSATTSDGAFFLSPAGVYLGSDSRDDIQLKLVIAPQGAEINVKQKAVQTVRAIR
jgi:hypothetical protein